MKKPAWLWLLQRISAAAVLIIIAIHIYNVHYLDIGSPIKFGGIQTRLESIFFLAIDSLLLFLGLFHGLNGVRTVLLDYNLFYKYERQLSIILICIGLFFSILGVKGLWAFIIK